MCDEKKDLIPIFFRFLDFLKIVACRAILPPPGLNRVKSLYSKISAEKPLAMFFSGDFNAHSMFEWTYGKNTPEEIRLDDLFSQLGLHQLINEPTNFEPKKIPLA